MSPNQLPRFSAFKRGALTVAAVAVTATLFQTAMPQPATGEPAISQEQVASPERIARQDSNLRIIQQLDGIEQTQSIEAVKTHLNGDGSRVVVRDGDIQIQYHLEQGRGSFNTMRGDSFLANRDLSDPGQMVTTASKQAIIDTIRGQGMESLSQNPQAFGAAVSAELQDVLDAQAGGANPIVIKRIELGSVVEQVFDPQTQQLRQGKSVTLGSARPSLADSLAARRMRDGADNTREHEAALDQTCRKMTCG